MCFDNQLIRESWRMRAAAVAAVRFAAAKQCQAPRKLLLPASPYGYYYHFYHCHHYYCEKKMETTKGPIGLCKDYIGIMEKRKLL